ncbi:MAG: hypothetical protein ABSF13_11975 [Smithella sp.]|jgi:hypothetical protein
MVNQRNIVFYFIVSMLVFFSQITDAQVNDDKNYEGDRISFPIKVTVKADKDYCIPAESTLLGMGVLDDNRGLDVKIKKGTTECDKTIVPDNVVGTIDSATMKKNHSRFGLTYGTLVVPFKYHLYGSKEFNGDSTVGPYLGYRFDKNTWWGIDLKLVGFAGASAIKVNQTVNGNATTQTLAGFSYGGGLISEIKHEFQMGLIFGWDQVSDSAKYEDNGKLWVAFGLGYSFSSK